MLGERGHGRGIASLLRSVGFDARVESADDVRVMAPTWRRDVRREVDLIEEVARLRGYDSFPDEIRPFRAGNVPDDPQWLLTRRVRDALVGAGLLEARPMPFVAGAAKGFVRVANPLAENEAYLRRDDSRHARASRRVQSRATCRATCACSRSARCSWHRPTRCRAKSCTSARSSWVAAHPPHFSDPKSDEFERAMTFDAWDAKALAELVAGEAFCEAPRSHSRKGSATCCGESSTNARAMNRRSGPSVASSLDAPVWATPAFGVELSLGVVDSANVAPPGDSTRIGEPEYPSVRVGPFQATPVARRRRSSISRCSSRTDCARARSSGRSARVSGDLLESRGARSTSTPAQNIEAGHRSLAWRLTFRHPERTLRERKSKAVAPNVLRHLEKS